MMREGSEIHYRDGDDVVADRRFGYRDTSNGTSDRYRRGEHAICHSQSIKRISVTATGPYERRTPFQTDTFRE